MEDLREVGKKVIDTIKNTKPADAGDLTLAIGNIIGELRQEPEGLHAKLDHLEGLFRELTYGEPCGSRHVEDPDDLLREDMSQTIGGLSGVMPNIPPIPVSGAISGSFTLPAFNYANQQTPMPMANPNAFPSVSFDDDHDYDDLTDEELELEMVDRLDELAEKVKEPESEPKSFKKRWWNTQ